MITLLSTIIAISSISLIINCVLWIKHNRHTTQLRQSHEQIDKLLARYDERTAQWETTLRDIGQTLRDQQQQYQQQLATLLNNAHLQQSQSQQQITTLLNSTQLQQQQALATQREQLQQEFTQHRSNFDQHQLNTLKVLQESLQNSMYSLRQQLTETLNQNAETISKWLDKLSQTTHDRLKEISGQVEQRLTAGFEKTTATFTDIIKRLALIDEAQKKITELSNNVVSLQEVLGDKRTRGAFGEVQLSALLRNMLPESHFALQHTLNNGKRADCILFLPEPTGNMVIDAKFPLENYQRMMDNQATEVQRKLAEQQFRLDIRKHMQDIAGKYIIPGTTADGAMMFIPAEAVFAEIHAHYPDLIEESQRLHVWLVSPTTMMAILTTARAVLKDAATRQQVHIIQDHLRYLAKDFDRFQKRMDTLAKHIDQAHDDVKDVQISAEKISSRFGKIEKVEIAEVADVAAVSTIAEVAEITQNLDQSSQTSNEEQAETVNS